MARALVLVAALTLAGCGVTQPRVVTVERPIPVPCIAAADVPPLPTWAMDSLPADASSAEITIAAGAIDLPVAVDHITKLRILIGACTDGS